MSVASVLKIKDYEVEVCLGCSDEERKNPQKVLFNIEISFNQRMIAEETDRLQDSIDYVHLTEIVKDISAQKSYHMIEHLCSSVAAGIKNNLKGQYQGDLCIQLHKIQVPIENLHGGVQWSCKINL